VSATIVVTGLGAVSPAGWGMEPFRHALASGQPLAKKELSRPGWNKPLRVRQVPTLQPRPAFLASARLRRSSPISQYATGAALEALGSDASKASRGELNLGIVLTANSGCVNYSRRFYEETLRDPSTASPLVFPETVFNAPSSHIASLLETNAINYTVVGDTGTFLQGLALAADWLSRGRVDSCLVIGSEEIDWLTADAYRLFQKEITVSEGAGAIYLKRGNGSERTVELEAVTSSHLFLSNQSRHCAAQKMKAELCAAASNSDSLLSDSTQDLPRLDSAEREAWQDWRGKRISVKNIFGEGMIAASAWQCLAAIEALQQGQCTSANVSIIGCNQQAIGARFSLRTLKTPNSK
jgi:hypothetical protein